MFITQTRPTILIALLLGLSLPLAGCGTARGGDDDDDSASVGDDDDSVPDPETDCLDQVDNDSDGLVDCEDDDCTDVTEECAWPTELGHSTSLSFDFDDWVEMLGQSDCVTEFTSDLSSDIYLAHNCTDCDLVYAGTFTYTADTCPDDPDNPRPTSGTFGISFGGDVSGDWEVFTDDGTDTWSSVGVAVSDGTSRTLQRTDPVDVPDYGDVGDLTTTLVFMP